MAIIYTYPTVTPTSNDLVILSDVGTSGKPTKTATVSSLLSVGLAQNIDTAKVTLSAAQIAALHSTPVTIVPAPGAGKYLIILSVQLAFKYTAPQFTTDGAGDVELKYATSNGKLTINDLNLASTPWTGAVNENKMIAMGNLVQGNWGENEALQLAITSGTANSLAGGSSTADIYVTYKIVDI